MGLKASCYWLLARQAEWVTGRVSLLVLTLSHCNCSDDEPKTKQAGYVSGPTGSFGRKCLDIPQAATSSSRAVRLSRAVWRDQLE